MFSSVSDDTLSVQTQIAPDFALVTVTATEAKRYTNQSRYAWLRIRHIHAATTCVHVVAAMYLTNIYSVL
jgi:hypothetical protein